MATTKQAIVFIYIAGQPVPAGVLTTFVDGRYTSSEFVYGSRYIERPDAIAVDPVSLPLPSRKEFVYRTKPDFSVFNGIRDAGPDKWGRYLLDKKYSALGLDEFDYIVSSGPDRVGALGFGADPQSGIGTWDGSKFIAVVPDRFPNLAQIQLAVDHAEDPDDPDFQKFLEYGPSLGGARPKGTVIWKDRLYLAKFSLKTDGWNLCCGEFATMLLAADCGMNVPPVDVTEVLGKSVYLVERFDRVNIDRIPFHSALTMTDSHEADYGRHSYKDIIEAISRFSPTPELDRKELYRRMVFNIFCSNTDDHMRNHGFIYAGNGQWKLSPLYDVVPFPQSTNSWSLALNISNQGRVASIENALAAAPAFGLNNGDAISIIDQIRERVSDWRNHYATCGLSELDIQKISSCFHLSG